MTMHALEVPREEEAEDTSVMQLSLAHLLYSATTPAFMQPLDCSLEAARRWSTLSTVGTDGANATPQIEETKTSSGGSDGDLPLLWRTMLAYRQLRKRQLVLSPAVSAQDETLFPSSDDAQASSVPTVKSTLSHVWHTLCRTNSTASPTSSFSCAFNQLPTATLVRGPYTLTVTHDNEDKTFVRLSSCEVPGLVMAEQLDTFSSFAPDFVHVQPDAATGTVCVRVLSLETAPALLRARELGLLLYVFLLQDLLDEAQRGTAVVGAVAPVRVDGAVLLEREPTATGGTAASLSHLFNRPKANPQDGEDDDPIGDAPARDVGPSDHWRCFRHLSKQTLCFSLEDTLHLIFRTYVDPLATMLARSRDTLEAIAASAAAEAAEKAAAAAAEKTDTATVDVALIAANGTEKASKPKKRPAEQDVLFRLLQWQLYAAPLPPQPDRTASCSEPRAPTDGPLPIAAVILPEELRHCYRACSETELPAVLITLMNAKGTMVHFYDDEAVGLLQRALKSLHAEVFVYDDVQTNELFQLLLAHQKDQKIPVTSETPFREQIFELERLLLDLDKLTAAEEEEKVRGASLSGIDPVLASAQRYDPYTVLMLQRHKKIFTALRCGARPRKDGSQAYTVGDALPPHFYSFVLQSLQESGVEYGEKISSNLLQASRRVISKFNQRLKAQ